MRGRTPTFFIAVRLQNLRATACRMVAPTIQDARSVFASPSMHRRPAHKKKRATGLRNACHVVIAARNGARVQDGWKSAVFFRRQPAAVDDPQQHRSRQRPGAAAHCRVLRATDRYGAAMAPDGTSLVFVSDRPVMKGVHPIKADIRGGSNPRGDLAPAPRTVMAGRHQSVCLMPSTMEPRCLHPA